MKFELFLFVVLSVVLVSVDSNCKWYGNRCYRRKNNCAYDGPPKPFRGNNRTMKGFAELCPDLAPYMESGLCCDRRQFSKLSSSLGMAGLLVENCPSCYRNFRQIFCQMTCSPFQDKFLRVDEKKTRRKKTGITKATYFLSTSMLNNTIKSCNKNYGYMSGYSLNNFCGTEHVEDCTPQQMATFLGMNSPFAINFTVLDVGETFDDNGTTYQPAHATTVACDHSTLEDKPACKADDCNYGQEYFDTQGTNYETTN